jgi:hypothetical protein
MFPSIDRYRTGEQLEHNCSCLQWSVHLQYVEDCSKSMHYIELQSFVAPILKQVDEEVLEEAVCLRNSVVTRE